MTCKAIASLGIIFLMTVITPVVFQRAVVTAQEVQTVESQEITGRITKIEDRTLFIETDEGVRQIQVPENVQIQRNGSSAQLNEFSVNDRVTVMYDNTNSVLSVESTSNSIIRGGLTTVGVVAGAALLALVLLYFWKKGTEPHIKTAVS